MLRGRAFGGCQATRPVGIEVWQLDSTGSDMNSVAGRLATRRGAARVTIHGDLQRVDGQLWRRHHHDQQHEACLRSYLGAWGEGTCVGRCQETRARVQRAPDHCQRAGEQWQSVRDRATSRAGSRSCRDKRRTQHGLEPELLRRTPISLNFRKLCAPHARVLRW